MVRHQAISNDWDIVFLCLFPGPLKIVKPIIVVVEYILPIVSPLQGMMAYIGYNKASVPWHAWDISEVGMKCHLFLIFLALASSFSASSSSPISLQHFAIFSKTAATSG